MDDIYCLKQILLYRKMGIPIETIRQLLGKPGMAGVFRFIWTAAILLAPVILLAGGAVDRNGGAVPRLLTGAILFVITWEPFLRFRKDSRRERAGNA